LEKINWRYRNEPPPDAGFAYFHQASFYLLYKLPASQASPPGPLTLQDKAVYGESMAASPNLQGAE